VGQPIMAAAAFRGGSALERRNRSDCCKAETQTSCGAEHFRDDVETAKAGIWDLAHSREDAWNAAAAM